VHYIPDKFPFRSKQLLATVDGFFTVISGGILILSNPVVGIGFWRVNVKTKFAVEYVSN
jgi:hypothetical protein